MALLSSIWLAGCSVFGIRDVAEPPHDVLAHVGAIEIRQYGPRVAAETTVEGGSLHARNVGFRRIAGYIVGGNHTSARIAMTAPVAQLPGPGTGTRIAMTAPVTQADAGTGGWTIRFFMPAGNTLHTLPVPNDASVRLVALPAETFAVLGFSGRPTPAAVRREQVKLLDGLRGGAWSPTGAPVAWFYDPPWTMPPLRRNEVAVEAAHTGR